MIDSSWAVQVPLQKFQAAASWSVLTGSKGVPGQAGTLNVALCACWDSNPSRAEPLPKDLIWTRAMQVGQLSWPWIVTLRWIMALQGERGGEGGRGMELKEYGLVL